MKRGRWWVAWTDDVPGALTQGRTLAEARENLKDAIALMLEPLEPGAPAERSTRLLTETLIL
ncbi:MAG: type II toxin-antitoxin system HicB family antitoxin [Acidobacteria bacterium]|nr:type II toxin-antitoxin system HicB family antitoxin [Acidobacteriota bacterium]